MTDFVVKSAYFMRKGKRNYTFRHETSVEQYTIAQKCESRWNLEFKSMIESMIYSYNLNIS